MTRPTLLGPIHRGAASPDPPPGTHQTPPGASRLPGFDCGWDVQPQCGACKAASARTRRSSSAHTSAMRPEISTRAAAPGPRRSSTRSGRAAGRGRLQPANAPLSLALVLGHDRADGVTASVGGHAEKGWSGGACRGRTTTKRRGRGASAGGHGRPSATAISKAVHGSGSMAAGRVADGPMASAWRPGATACTVPLPLAPPPGWPATALRSWRGGRQAGARSHRAKAFSGCEKEEKASRANPM